MLKLLMSQMSILAVAAAASLLKGSRDDSPHSPAEFVAANLALRSAAADIAGLTLLNDEGKTASSIVTRTGFALIPCGSVAEVLAAVEAGKVGYLDIEFFTLGCVAIGDGRYYCNGTDAGEWVASSLDVAREWLSRAVAVSAMIDTKVLSG